MTRKKIWVAVSADLPRDPDVATLSSGDARWGWLVTMCEAKRLYGKPWKSEAHYRACVGEYARFLPEYLDRRWLVQSPSGELRLRRWAKWQFPLLSTPRVRRWRERQQGTA